MFEFFLPSQITILNVLNSAEMVSIIEKRLRS